MAASAQAGPSVDVSALRRIRACRCTAAAHVQHRMRCSSVARCSEVSCTIYFLFTGKLLHTLSEYVTQDTRSLPTVQTSSDGLLVPNPYPHWLFVGVGGELKVTLRVVPSRKLVVRTVRVTAWVPWSSVTRTQASIKVRSSLSATPPCSRPIARSWNRASLAGAKKPKPSASTPALSSKISSSAKPPAPRRRGLITIE